MTLLVNRNVTRLDLAGSRLGEEDVRAAGAALRHPHCALQTLRRVPRCPLSAARVSGRYCFAFYLETSFRRKLLRSYQALGVWRRDECSTACV